MKDECTFCFSKFLVIGLGNSLANSWFGITLFYIADLSFLFTVFDQEHVTAPPEVLAPENFLSKKLIYK